MAIAAAALGGDGPKVGLELNSQGCCGNSACCSSGVSQANNNTRITYTVQAEQGDDEPEVGVLSPEQQNFILRLLKKLCCCCCSSAKEAEENALARERFQHVLAQQHGEDVAQAALDAHPHEDFSTPEGKAKPLRAKAVRELQESAKKLQLHFVKVKNAGRSEERKGPSPIDDQAISV